MSNAVVENGKGSGSNRKCTRMNNCAEYFSEYSENTSIHGIKYVGEYKRSIVERIIWLVIICISLYLCSHLIIETYTKWKTAPVIVSFAKSPTPVWQIPFPAVTVCPETKTRQRAYNFTAAYHKYHEEFDNMTKEEILKFQKISMVCDSDSSDVQQNGEKTIDYDTIDLISEVAPQLLEMLWQCKWLNENETCDTLFTPMLTEEGVCYTFNMLNREEIFTNIVFQNGEYLQHPFKAQNWTLEKGYPTDQGIESFPRRAIAAGQQACLSLIMFDYIPDLDYVCRGAIQGFKILLHNPAEMPRVSQRYIRVPLNQEIVIAIKPDMMTTSEALKEYDATSRQCFFPYERGLKYFQIYTQPNCEVECLTNITLRKCGCVSYHMPHDESTPLCGPGNLKCVKEAQGLLLPSEVQHDSNVQADGCNCLPSCTSLSYNGESSQAHFNWPKVFEAYKVNFSEFPGVAMTRLMFFFKDQQFITSERNELYGVTDFLANCGGLLGLFIGFSFLSLIEIFYFLSLRVCASIYIHNHE